MNDPSQPILPWPKDELEAVPDCPACGSSERVLRHADLVDRIFFAADGRWTMWQCSRCSTGWLDPRPDRASIGRAYDKYYTHAEDEAQVSPPPESTNKLGNGYRNWRFGSTAKPASRLGIVAGLLVPNKRREIDLGHRFLPSLTKVTVRSALDIGCGDGAFLDVAAEIGWACSGVEPDDKARRVAAARGHQVYADLDSLPAETSFGYVCLSHVIEHVHDPLLYLRRVYRLLAPGGRLFIATPNIDSVGHQLYGADWRGLEPPRHLVMFSRRSLKRAMIDAGFGKVHFKSDRKAFDFTSRQSRLIRDRADPYGSNVASGAEPRAVERFKAGHSWKHAEFLTVIAEKLASG